MEDITRTSDDRRRALVFGGSGQIGVPLLANLRRAGWQVTAVSRRAQKAQDGLNWVTGDLSVAWPDESHFDVVFSCGPLDQFARWFAESAIDTPRVVAFGSTSVEVKQESIDLEEREVARRLRVAEASLFTEARGRGVAVTILRPTLIYGAGRDKTLSSIASIARRCGVFVLPLSAKGPRQPVHVQDLADAAMQVLDHPITVGQTYALGGGEVLDYTEMVRRVLAALQPPSRLVRVPLPIFRLALHTAHAVGRLRIMTVAALARMREPLVFDIEPARRDFGYAPRSFRIDAAMVTAPESTG